MKFSLECETDCKIQLPKEISIKHEDKTYIFYPGEGNILKRIKIIADVKHPEQFYSIIKATPNEKSKMCITINRDKELYDSIIKDFQELESRLAFNSNLKKIRWEELKEEVICETDEERKKVGIIGNSQKKQYKDDEEDLDEKFLRDIIETKEKYSSLTIPLSFWREANNDFKSFRYIHVFFNSYFILEGLYGNGKDRNYAIEKEFIKSKEFTASIEWIIKNIEKEPRHIAKINEMLKQVNKQLYPKGLIHLIVSVRGKLHHFANQPHKLQGTPFNHNKFESIAFITFVLASRAILQKILDINTGNTPK